MRAVKRQRFRFSGKHSGRPLEEVVRDTDRDHFMSADEAKDWGLIDKVIEAK